VQRWTRLLGTEGIPADSRALQLARPTRPPAVSNAVIVHPGASAEARRWPVDRFGQVAGALSASGYSVVVTGSAAERTRAVAVARRAGLDQDSVLAGDLDLAGLAALMASARLLISGDTGIAHLASAYATPSVVLFGPTSPLQWGPPAGGPYTVIWRGSQGTRTVGGPIQHFLVTSWYWERRSAKGGRGPAWGREPQRAAPRLSE
jgi:ADP-heptose:LPS heptosyltransferase